MSGHVDPHAFTEVVLAWLAGLTFISAAFAALALKVLQNARDIQAAWHVLRSHEKKLNGGPPPPP